MKTVYRILSTDLTTGRSTYMEGETYTTERAARKAIRTGEHHLGRNALITLRLQVRTADGKWIDADE